MPDIFISYAREDKQKAALLANKLIASGWNVWWDYDLLGGEDYDVVIERELAKAKAAIVIWSALSAQSRPVKDEANKALRNNKLVPVSFDNTEPPIGFGMTHTLYFKRSNQLSPDEYTKLYESIKNKAGAPGSSLPPPPPPRKKNIAAWFIVGAAVLALVIYLIVSNSGKPGTESSKGGPIDTATTVSPPADTPQPVSTEAEEVAAFFKTMRPLEPTLTGDTIGYYTIKDVTHNSITLNVGYNYNRQHGNQVSLGAWLWKSPSAGGYVPVMLTSPDGSAEITITLSDLKGSITSQGILLFIAESYKGPFAYRVYSYPHTWSP